MGVLMDKKIIGGAVGLYTLSFGVQAAELAWDNGSKDHSHLPGNAFIALGTNTGSGVSTMANYVGDSVIDGKYDAGHYEQAGKLIFRVGIHRS